MNAPRVLHLIREANETAAPYNEHVLSGVEVVGAASFFPPALSGLPWSHLRHGDGSLASYLRTIRIAVDDFRPDVVHAHSPHVGAAWVAASTGMARRIPLVYTLHTSWDNVSSRNRALLLPVFLSAARVVFCSEASFASIPRELMRQLGPRVAVVPNGVALDRLDGVAAQAGARHDRSTLNVLVVGRLLEKKDPRTSLRALARVAELPIRLAYVGRGDLAESLEQEAARLGLGERVEFRGVVAREELYRILAVEADVLVSTSRTEGLPLAPLEAMALGVPVVLSDIAPHREIVEGLVGVPLVPPGDDRSLALALRSLAEAGAEELRIRGARGRAHVRAAFGLDLMLRRYARLYAEVVRGR